MYLGEGKCYYERMAEFIKVAKDLEVKEISKGVMFPKVEEVVTEETVVDNQKKETDEVEQKPTPDNPIRHRQPRNQISSDAKFTECPECEKEFSKKCHMLRHYRSVHEGIKYSCDQCDYQATQSGDLQTHIQSVHEGIKYPCSHCNHQFTDRSSLRRHIHSKHEGIKYPCNQC